MNRRLLLALLLALPTPLAAQFGALDSIVAEGVRRGVYPGAAVVVGTSTAIVHTRGFGHFTWDPRSPAPDPATTAWDLASLTKVVATTAAAALLVDQGRLALDTPVRRYLPRFAGGAKDQVTVRMLLDHTSGLPAWVDFARLTRDRDGALALLYATPLRRPPGTRAEYSDLNAILLGLVVERVAARPLERITEDSIFAPLGMRNTRYLPPDSWRARVAPTGVWHGHPIAGEVNDQNSKRLGGVSGHAGLFASAADVARYAQWWLRRGSPLVRPATIDTFLSSDPAAGARLLGWESRTTDEYTPSPYGTLPTLRAYGHTGWTGTMLWIDPERDLFVVFLTNRAFGPKVAKPFTALHEIRAKVADAAVRATPGACRAEIRPVC
ncbi:MAG TPA: serine hydrolase domain-containing protein [Gemmatimonadales bacterium]|nr:serine hydrolase domain-containing protein [Gemmatimonadales bacterium]